MTALSPEEQNALWRQAEEAKKGLPVTRNLVGGPLDGKKVIIPQNQQTNDVGWFTMHYVLQPSGVMRWERKE